MKERLAFLIKASLIVGFMWWFFWFTGFASFFENIFEQSKIEHKERNIFCQEHNISRCNIGVVDCARDCHSLEKEYFKYSDGGFGSNECWCKNNNEVQQIW